MSQRLSKIIGFLLACFGLYQLFKEVYTISSGNIVVPALLVVVLTISWLLYEFINYIYNPFVFRFFNAKPLVDSDITNIKIELFIDNTGQATSHSWRTYIFRRKPKPWDTYDTLFVKGEFLGNIEDYYISDDAIVSSYKRLEKNKILVFWKPKKMDIKPHFPYEHHYVYKPPSNFNDDVNFYILYKICPVGLSEFIVHTHRSIKDVWAIEIIKHKNSIDEEQAEQLVRQTKEFSIPQPVKTKDGFRWQAYGEEFDKPILILFRYLSKSSNNKINADVEIAGAISTSGYLSR